LIVVFSLAGFLSAFPSCLGETEVREEVATKVLDSTPCLNEQRNIYPFLAYAGLKKTHFPKPAKSVLSDYHVSFLHEGFSSSPSPRLSVPDSFCIRPFIYQLKAVYPI
jgi:hypothetical protein